MSSGLSREERTLSVYPLTISDLNRPEFLNASDMPTCLNCQIHFLRPKDDERTWSGYVNAS